MLWWGIAVAVLTLNVWWLLRQRRWLAARYLVETGVEPKLFVMAAGLGVGCLGFVGVVGTAEQTGPALALTMAVVPLGYISSWIDSLTFRLPLRLTGMLALELILLSLLFQVDRYELWLAGFLGAQLWGIVLLVGHLWGNQVGKGDVLFGALLGFWLGTMAITLSAVGLLLANVALIVGVFLGRRGRPGVSRKRVPFGPYLWAAAVAVWVLYIVGTGPHLVVVCGKLGLC